MPRRKKLENDSAPQEPQQPNIEETPKPKRLGRRKSEPAEAEAVQSAEKPRGLRLFRRKEKPAAVEPAVQEPVADAPAPKKRARPGPKQEAQPEPPSAEAHATDDADEFAVKFREREGARLPGTRPKSKPASGESASATKGGRPTGEQRSRGRAKARPAPLDSFGDLGEDMPIPSWRPRKSAEGDVAVEAPMGEGPIAPRRSRRGRRKETQPEPVRAVVEAPAARVRKERVRKEAVRPEPKLIPLPEPLPPKPVRPVIAIPDDAPQIVLREGIPTLVRNHRVYAPISFFGSSSDAPRAGTVIEEMKMAGEAGVHVHSHLVEFEVDPRSVESSVAFAAYMLNKSVEADPEAQVLFRLVFIAPAGWMEAYPDAKYETEDGALAEPSVSDDKFWEVAKSCLREFVRLLRLLDAKDHILGLHLERGEWFYAQGWGYDTSTAARHKFRDWARMRYRNDIVALRAAWFDGNANFNTLTIPEYRADGSHEKFIRSSRKERRWVDYHLFLSDATVERIGDLAYAAKDASEGYFLLGVSYGYTFEWSHPASGHLSLGKLLRTPEVDFIAGPPSYQTRQPGGAAPFPGPIDSFALNGKLYISEEDFKTSIGGRSEPDDFNPVIKTPQALESVHWRGAGSALAHASGICWMDLWGNGWLKTSGIWHRAAEVRQCLIRRMAAPYQDPDVAVFIDERALAYLVDEEAFALLVQNVRESVLRSGLSAAFYLLSDLQHREKFPECKLYLFLNAWDIRPELRSAIKNRLQRDNKVLFWVFAAGLFDSGRESLERAREVTGIALKPQPFHSKAGTTILNRRHPLCDAFPERQIVGNARMEPSYFAIPEEATVLGEYTQTGLPSFVVKEFTQGDPKDHWKSVFLGEPIVTPSLLRALGHMAGVHVWNYQDDVVHVRLPFVTIHCTGAGPRTLTLPNKWSGYNLLTDQWHTGDNPSIRFQAGDGSTHLFLAGSKEELDHVLTADPVEMLRMEELPPRPDNTVRFDAAGFDVPIMRLDEWMEGGDSDEVSDEFLFRPKFVDEPESEGEKAEPNGRRRRRRGRSRGDGPEEAPGIRVAVETPSEEGDIGMNVIFRRRK